MTDPASTDWIHILAATSPMLAVLLGACSTLLIAAFNRHKTHVTSTVYIMAAAVLGAAFLGSWYLWIENMSVAAPMLALNRFTYLGWLIIFLGSGFVVLLSTSYLPERSRVRIEYYAMMLFAVFGMTVLIAATDLITIVIGIETTALAAYVLAGSLHYKHACNEASLKYFVAGAFSLAFFIMGIAFILGGVGTTDLASIGERAAGVIASDRGAFFLVGCALILIGFGFKIATVPFHAWAPDVYDGAPTPITAFIAGTVKVAAFIALTRLAHAAYVHAGTSWVTVSAGLAIVTMLIGNLAAIAQENIKRLLAYSSIAHAGYLLVAFPSFASPGTQVTAGVIFYLIAYAFMTIGAFAVIIALNEGHEEHNNITALAGLGRNRPGMAAALTFFLISLAGFPPTLGFFAKYYLFLGAVKSGFTWLVVIAVINNAMAIFYYLKPVVVMYLRDDRGKAPTREYVKTHPVSYAVTAVVFVCVLVIAFFGLIPTNLLTLILHSV